MTAAKQIVEKVEKFGTDRVFSIADLELPTDWWANIKVKLNRMVNDGKLVKIANGKYYRPRISLLGPVPPSSEELVKDIMYEDGKLVGYLTGYSIWDSMGLTTQFSSTIVVGLNRRKDPMIRSGRNIRFVLQPNEIKAEYVHLLQILDTLKFIKKVPDSTVNRTIIRLQNIIKDLSDNDITLLAKLALKYPPRVRAISGSLIDSVGYNGVSLKLKGTLNPLTEFKFGIDKSILSTAKNWNIV